MTHLRRRQRDRNANARPPMLVMRAIHNKNLETKEWAAVTAFQMGVANKGHFDLLMDMANLLLLAGSAEDGEYATRVYRGAAKLYAEQDLIPMLTAIQKRYNDTGKLGVSAAELKVMRQMIEWSRQFWNRQPIELFHTAAGELKAYYASLAEIRKLKETA